MTFLRFRTVSSFSAMLLDIVRGSSGSGSVPTGTFGLLTRVARRLSGGLMRGSTGGCHESDKEKAPDNPDYMETFSIFHSLMICKAAKIHFF